MLKSRLSDLTKCGIPAFNFAGISFPKHVWTLPRGSVACRVEQHTPGKMCTGDYYHAPRPVDRRGAGQGFYLDSDGMHALRWKWADEVIDLGHTGWWSDEYGDSEKIRGLVFRLPSGRGFLAGWSMGKGMASSLDYDIYSDEESAAYAADSMAEDVAEQQREFEAELEEEES